MSLTRDQMSLPNMRPTTNEPVPFTEETLEEVLLNYRWKITVNCLLLVTEKLYLDDLKLKYIYLLYNLNLRSCPFPIWTFQDVGKFSWIFYPWNHESVDNWYPNVLGWLARWNIFTFSTKSEGQTENSIFVKNRLKINL